MCTLLLVDRQVVRRHAQDEHGDGGLVHGAVARLEPLLVPLAAGLLLPRTRGLAAAGAAVFYSLVSIILPMKTFSLGVILLLPVFLSRDGMARLTARLGR